MALDIKEAVEALYVEFKAPRPRHIEACPCCTDEAELKRLMTTPLETLSADHLSSYLGSLFHTVGNVIDYKYFLPRIFELATTDAPWSASTEVVMDKLRLANWHEWPASEKAAILAFVDTWFEATLRNSVEPDYGIYSCSPIDELICGIARAGLPLEPYLERLLSAPLALKLLYFSNETSLQDRQCLANAFWQGHEQAGLTVVAFLQSGEVLDILTR